MRAIAATIDFFPALVAMMMIKRKKDIVNYFLT
jgi:hypothetical protein